MSRSNTIRIRPTARHYHFNTRLCNIVIQLVCLVACLCILAIPESILSPGPESSENEVKITQPILALIAVGSTGPIRISLTDHLDRCCRTFECIRVVPNEKL